MIRIFLEEGLISNEDTPSTSVSTRSLAHSLFPLGDPLLSQMWVRLALEVSFGFPAARSVLPGWRRLYSHANVSHADFSES